MPNESVIIQCSARKEGDTGIAASFIAERYSLDTVDLSSRVIHPFDYDNRHEGDDFLPLLRMLAEQYNNWLFMTPVYWYTMSGRMKIFLDRMTDLLKWHKPLGRSLRGKTMGLVSISNDEELNTCFETPVALSAEYLGMHYKGHCHCWLTDRHIESKAEAQLVNYMKRFMSA